MFVGLDGYRKYSAVYSCQHVDGAPLIATFIALFVIRAIANMPIALLLAKPLLPHTSIVSVTQTDPISRGVLWWMYTSTMT